jgi:hypothetical protein
MFTLEPLISFAVHTNLIHSNKGMCVHITLWQMLLSLLFCSVTGEILQWSNPPLRVEHRLRVFENRVLRSIFGPKRNEVTEEWR